eukprot:GGOE01036335.1.p1 GENE.GGOE01036335.1~~GGOE01036335.1.p1  ORF type:complete len:120 (+),score=34.34 GGOE01036335.1:44-361(+)
MGNVAAIKCLEGATVVGEGPDRRWVYDAKWKGLYLSPAGDAARLALQALLLANASFLVVTSGKALLEVAAEDVHAARESQVAAAVVTTLKRCWDWAADHLWAPET